MKGIIDRTEGLPQRLNSPESSPAAHFRGLLVSLFECPAAQLAGVRREIADHIVRAADPTTLLEQLIDWCVERRSEGGLHRAIDTLSQTHDLPFDYAGHFRADDVTRWSRDIVTDWHPNDDIWFILLSAIGRAATDRDRAVRFIWSCASAGNRGVREAVVEGLSAVGTPGAIEHLEALATADPDPMIRQLASLELDDLR